MKKFKNQLQLFLTIVLAVIAASIANFGVIITQISFFSSLKKWNEKVYFMFWIAAAGHFSFLRTVKHHEHLSGLPASQKEDAGYLRVLRYPADVSSDRHLYFIYLLFFVHPFGSGLNDLLLFIHSTNYL